MDDAAESDPGEEPVVSCTLQGGTVSVYEGKIDIERSSASMFEDKTIPMSEVRGVAYESGILTGHIQVEQVGVVPDEAGLLGHPVDENTLYISRSKRQCARRARDAILEHAEGR
jgi:hypothetical protein